MLVKSAVSSTLKPKKYAQNDYDNYQTGYGQKNYDYSNNHNQNYGKTSYKSYDDVDEDDLLFSMKYESAANNNSTKFKQHDYDWDSMKF